MTRKSHRKHSRGKVRRQSMPGASPGTLQPDPQAHASSVHVIRYGPDSFDERKVASVAELRDLVRYEGVTWIRVVGLANADLIRQVGEFFGLHRLALEDVVNVHQLAKVETYPNSLFLVARVLMLNHRLDSDQVSIFLTKKAVITFEECESPYMNPVLDRLRHAVGRIRQASADYLAYALLDAVLDTYFPIVESYMESIDKLEEDLLAGERKTLIGTLHGVRGDLHAMWRTVWHQREALSMLLSDPPSLVCPETMVYFRDCYDHTLQLLDLIDTYREATGHLMQLELALANNRMSEVMKVLTVVASVFIPLTFIVGVYGMNFEHMPELKWRYGYAMVWGVMIVVTIGMLSYFQYKGWLFGDGRSAIRRETAPPRLNFERRLGPPHHDA